VRFGAMQRNQFAAVILFSNRQWALRSLSNRKVSVSDHTLLMPNDEAMVKLAM
jgi:hypothetical protein